MKRSGLILSFILTCITGGVVTVLSLALLVIEGRLLFSGEWMLHEVAVFAFIRYLFKFLLAVGGIVVGASTYVKPLESFRCVLSVALFAVTLAMCPFITNYMNVALPAVALLHLLATLLLTFLRKKEKNLTKAE